MEPQKIASAILLLFVIGSGAALLDYIFGPDDISITGNAVKVVSKSNNKLSNSYTVQNKQASNIEATEIQPEFGLTDPGLFITISDSSSTGTYKIPLTAFMWNSATQKFEWSLLKPVVISNQIGNVLATLTSAEVEFTGCNKIDIDFNLIAGQNDIQVVMDSSKLWFPTILSDDSRARATASFTAQDLNNDGVSLIGLDPPGSGMFWAYYNGLPPDGIRFANLMGAIIAGPGGTATGSQRQPSGGYQTLGRDVSDMSGRIRFTITPYDRAAGSVSYHLAPELYDCDYNWLVE